MPAAQDEAKSKDGLRVVVGAPRSRKTLTRLHSLFTKADALIVTQMCRERLLALNPAVPVILVLMTIDQQSIDFLRGKIAALEQASTAL